MHRSRGGEGRSNGGEGGRAHTQREMIKECEINDKRRNQPLSPMFPLLTLSHPNTHTHTYTHTYTHTHTHAHTHTYTYSHIHTHGHTHTHTHIHIHTHVHMHTHTHTHTHRPIHDHQDPQLFRMNCSIVLKVTYVIPVQSIIEYLKKY